MISYIYVKNLLHRKLSSYHLRFKNEENISNFHTNIPKDLIFIIKKSDPNKIIIPELPIAIPTPNSINGI